MTPAIANAALDGDFILKFALAVLLALQIATLIAGFMRGRDAARRSVSFEGVPLDKSEFEKHVSQNREEHDHIFSKLGGVERGIRAEVKTDLAPVIEEQKRMGQQLAALNQSNHSQERHLEKMDQKLDDLRDLISKAD